MNNGVIIRMRDSQEHYIDGNKDEIAKAINAAKGQGNLIALYRERIPRGQTIWIDPNEVTSVRQDYDY